MLLRNQAMVLVSHTTTSETSIAQTPQESEAQWSAHRSNAGSSARSIDGPTKPSPMGDCGEIRWLVGVGVPVPDYGCLKEVVEYVRPGGIQQ